MQIQKAVICFTLCLICTVCTAGEKFTTNDFRIAGGQLYNIRRSSRWMTFESLEVQKVLTNAVIAQTLTIKEIRGPRPAADSLTRAGIHLGSGRVVERPLGPLLGTERIYGEKYYILNHPERETLATKRLIAVRVLYLGTTNIDGETLNFVDCGLPNTLENRKTLKQ